jgi:hypothetical protein
MDSTAEQDDGLYDHCDFCGALDVLKKDGDGFRVCEQCEQTRKHEGAGHTRH